MTKKIVALRTVNVHINVSVNSKEGRPDKKFKFPFGSAKYSGGVCKKIG
jgi:hypothetical protein